MPVQSSRKLLAATFGLVAVLSGCRRTLQPPDASDERGADGATSAGTPDGAMVMHGPDAPTISAPDVKTPPASDAMAITGTDVAPPSSGDAMLPVSTDGPLPTPDMRLSTDLVVSDALPPPTRADANLPDGSDHQDLSAACTDYCARAAALGCAQPLCQQACEARVTIAPWCETAGKEALACINRLPLERLECAGGRLDTRDEPCADLGATFEFCLEDGRHPDSTADCAAYEKHVSMVNAEMLAEKTDTMSQLISMALACDLTRVFTVMFSGPTATTVFWQTNASEGHHGMTHDEGGAQPLVHASTIFTMSCFSKLLQTLKGVPEGAGNILDNSVVYGSTDVADGRDHSITNYPIVVAGGGGGFLKHPGIHYKSAGENTSTVLLTVLRAAGMQLTQFGAGGGLVTASCASIEA